MDIIDLEDENRW